MNLLTAIRIILYFTLAYFAITQQTLTGLLLGIGCLILAGVLYVVDFYSQVSNTETLQERAKRTFGDLPDNRNRKDYP